jgi:hypothetical protein
MTSKSTEMRTVFEDLDRITSFNIKLYDVGPFLRALNVPEYSIFRDGLVTIGGETSVGKSSLLTYIALDILAHNEDTCFLFYSLDDCDFISGNRIITQITKENQFLNRRFDRASLDERNKGKDLLRRVMIKDRISLSRIEDDAKEAKRLSGCKKIIIGIDYLQIMPNEDYGQTTEFLNVTVKHLKEIQWKLLDDQGHGCMVILLSQYSRNGAKEVPTIHRFRGSSEIENQSDVCLDISYSQLPKKKTHDRESPKRIVSIIKNKLGRKEKKFATSINESGVNFSYSDLVPQE